MKTYTVEEIAAAIVANSKAGNGWLSCRFPVELPDGTRQSVGIKAFGKWVQRIECCGFVDGLPEQRTQRDLRAKVVEKITHMMGLL